MSGPRESSRLAGAVSPLPEAPGETEEEASESPPRGSSSSDPLLAPELPGQEPSTAPFPAGPKNDTDSESSGAECCPTPICKICFQGAEQGILLNPCRCDGSVRYTHQLCLLKWISERGSWTCELCCYRYHVIAIRMKRPCQWQSITVTLVEKVQIIAVILGSLFLVSSVSWLLWSAFSPNALWQRKDILFQICYGMYGFMDLVCIALILHEGAAVYKVFMRWRAVNIHWNVLNYDKAMDIEESSQAMSSAARTLWLPLTSLRSRTLVHPAQLSSPRLQCGYVLIQLINRIRPQHNALENGNTGEVVMRVTSV
ncbi:E3 ubiquitin-protein ligase MARCHF11 [Lissotriton helveticus]